MQSSDEQDLIRLTNAFRKAEGALAVARKELVAKLEALCPFKVGDVVQRGERPDQFLVTKVILYPSDAPDRGQLRGRKLRKDGEPSAQETWLGYMRAEQFQVVAAWREPSYER